MPTLVLAMILALTGLGVGDPLDAQPGQEQAFDLVPEMQTPDGIEAAPRSERAALPSGQVAEDAIERVEARVAAMWPTIRGIDLAALSRFHLDEMDGYELPAEFGQWTGEVIGRGADGRLFVELRGPRLPAKYDIVFRYLMVYAAVDLSVDPAGGSVGRPVVTIRGWIEE